MNTLCNIPPMISLCSFFFMPIFFYLKSANKLFVKLYFYKYILAYSKSQKNQQQSA